MVSAVIRRLFSFLIFSSLILCVAVGVLWKMSYDHGLTVDDITLRTESGERIRVFWSPPEQCISCTRWQLESLPGTMKLRWSSIQVTDPKTGISANPEDGIGLTLSCWLAVPEEIEERLQVVPQIQQDIRNKGGVISIGTGIAIGKDPAADDVDGWESTLVDLLVPHWLLCALFAVLPASRMVFAVGRRMRRRPGCCVVCAYDLRATPERCPECGTVPESLTRSGRGTRA